MRAVLLLPFTIALLAPAATESDPIQNLKQARADYAKAKQALEEAESKVQTLIKERADELAALKDALQGEEEKPSKKPKRSKRPANRLRKPPGTDKDDKSESPREPRQYALTEREREIAEKTAQERRARRQGEEPEKLIATLEMKIPSKAKVWINGKRQRDSGKERSYQSPELKPGEEHRFKVRITWGNKEVKRTVVVKAGETLILAVGKAKTR